jgi:hypothetical protein
VTYLPRANEPVPVAHVHDERMVEENCPICQAQFGGGGTGSVGPAGPAGPAGAAATVAVGTTTTGAAGSNAAVTNTGTTSAAVFNFTVPRGAAGVAGAVGPAGPAGAVGPAGAAGVDGQDGVDGTSLSIQGAVPTYADLPADAVAGDCYVVEADGLLYDSDGVGFPPDGSGVPWVGPQGIQGVQGIQGAPGLGITYKGTVATDADLPATATSGDLYIVSEPAPAHGFVWDADTSAWVDAGPVQGPQGVPGEQGVPGIAGPAGADGADSTVPGPAGPTAVSADAGNTSKLGTDGLIFTPAPAAATGFLPLAGGTMTGTITVPSGVNAMLVNGTNYSMMGGSGGLAIRSGTNNLWTAAAANLTASVPIVTAGTGTGIQFGSGGPTMSRSSTMIAASAPITVAAAPATDPELANKKYVDDKVAAGGSAYTLPPSTATVLGGVKVGAGLAVTADGTLSSTGGAGVTNPVAGSVAGMVIWTGTQAAYDAAAKSSTTVYFITG